MKKKLGFIISGVVAIGILGFGVLYSSTSQAEASLSTEDIKDMVNEQYPGEITEIEQETEFNRAVYEVEIKTADKEYDIKLDGETGEVLNVSEKPIKNKEKVNNEKEKSTAKVEKDRAKENEKVKENKSEEQPKEVVINEKKEQQPTKEKTKEKAPKQKKSDSKETVISYDEAKRIALEAFAGEIDDIELDREDGRLIYEVEIERGDKEAEIEIDAYTGEIILIEIDED